MTPEPRKLRRVVGPAARVAGASRSAGFTLIELMVAVAIVSILATIAIQEFSNITLRSKRAEIAMNLNAIRTAQEAYRAEWEGYLECPLTPATPGGRVAVSFPSPAAGGLRWAQLGWAPDGRVYGQYMVEAFNFVGGEAHFTATGYSDIDADGNLAHFEGTDLVRPIMQTANNVY